MSKMRARVTPMLKSYHPDMELVTIFAESSREYLAVVAQLEDRPIVLKFGWIEFISHTDGELQEELAAQLNHKMAAQQTR
jgi:hypothetical protein